MRPSYIVLILLPIQSLALIVPLPPSLSLLSDTNSTAGLPNATLLSGSYLTEEVGKPYPICNQAYGGNLNIDSCANAWDKIKPSTTKRIFRSRQGALTEDELLPVRYLSNDGLCAIDIDAVDGRSIEESSDGKTISKVAGTILVQCVYRSKTGGSLPLDRKSFLNAYVPFAMHNFPSCYQEEKERNQYVYKILGYRFRDNT